MTLATSIARLASSKLAITSTILALFLSGCNADATDTLSEETIERDLMQFMYTTAGPRSMVEVSNFKVLKQERPVDGNLNVDTEIELKAVEAAKSQENIYNRHAVEARQADGRIERIRMMYKKTSADTWEFANYGPVPSTYSLKLDDGAIGPPEKQIRDEYSEMLRLVSAGSVSISRFEVIESEALSDTRVQLNLEITTKGDSSLGGNADMARETDGKTNQLDVIYRLGEAGAWVAEVPEPTE